MAVKPTAVSIRASRGFVQGLNALAKSKGTTVADLTKKAIDDCLGVELKPFLIFFDKSVDLNRQESKSSDSSGPGAA